MGAVFLAATSVAPCAAVTMASGVHIKAEGRLQGADLGQIAKSVGAALG